MLSCPLILVLQPHIQRVAEIKASLAPFWPPRTKPSHCLPVVASWDSTEDWDLEGEHGDASTPCPSSSSFQTYHGDLPRRLWPKRPSVTWGPVVLFSYRRWEMQNQIHACAALCCSVWNLLPCNLLLPVAGQCCLQWHRTDFPGQRAMSSVCPPAFSALST